MTVTPPWLRLVWWLPPRGFKGELRIQSSSDFPERFLEPGLRWLQTLDEPPRAVELLRGRHLTRKGLYGIRLKGIATRNQAETPGAAPVAGGRHHPSPLAPGEFHLLDLAGLEVRLAPAGPALAPWWTCSTGATTCGDSSAPRGAIGAGALCGGHCSPGAHWGGVDPAVPPAGLLPMEVQPPPADAIGSLRQPES